MSACLYACANKACENNFENVYNGAAAATGIPVLLLPVNSEPKYARGPE